MNIVRIFLGARQRCLPTEIRRLDQVPVRTPQQIAQAKRQDFQCPIQTDHQASSIRHQYRAVTFYHVHTSASLYDVHGPIRTRIRIRISSCCSFSSTSISVTAAGALGSRSTFVLASTLRRFLPVTSASFGRFTTVGSSLRHLSHHVLSFSSSRPRNNDSSSVSGTKSAVWAWKSLS